MSRTPHPHDEMRPPRHDCDEHDPCEGNALHIRGRDAMGCAQFQDGSWITKSPLVCFGSHRGLPRKRRPDYGEGDATRDWLEASFAANRAPGAS